MAIGTVIRTGSNIVIRDEKGNQTASIFSASPDDKIVGYTSTILTMRRGNSIVTYNEQGQQLSNDVRSID
jgi:hypothetical protein